jgi:hypothetical protein
VINFFHIFRLLACFRHKSSSSRRRGKLDRFFQLTYTRGPRGMLEVSVASDIACNHEILLGSTAY